VRVPIDHTQRGPPADQLEVISSMWKVVEEAARTAAAVDVDKCVRQCDS